MTRTTHNIYIGSMVLTVLVIAGYLAFAGYSYYIIPIEERFYHSQHDWFKPSGVFGHGLGILGTLMIVFGVGLYIARKRYNFLSKLIRIKYLLEFHIFLCTLGPVLILFHTSFKFGGIVSVAFWSMVLVVVSGVIGRFVYVQIPRTIEGRELTLNEVKNMKVKLSSSIMSSIDIDENLRDQIITVTSSGSDSPDSVGFIAQYFQSRRAIRNIRNSMESKNVPRKQRTSVLRLLREEISLSYKIRRLQTMQKLFRHWHVAHLPFALIMLIVLIIHVAVTISFGYKWIF